MDFLRLVDTVDLLKILATAIAFAFATWSDLKSREVTNRLWLVYFPLGALLGTIGTYLEGAWVIHLASAVFTSVTAILLFYLGFFGGADAKALMGLSLTLPYRPSRFSGRIGFDFWMPTYPFPISVLINSVVISVVIVIPYMLLKNLAWKLRNSEKKLFEGLEQENLLKKILAVMIGYKVGAGELERLFVYPLEEVKVEGEKRMRRLSFLISVDEGERRRGLLPKIEEEVWVSPGLPLMASILIGFLVALFYGDLVFALTSSILSFAIRYRILQFLVFA